MIRVGKLPNILGGYNGLTRQSDIQKTFKNNVIDNCLYTYNNLIINFQLHLILGFYKLADFFSMIGPISTLY